MGSRTTAVLTRLRRALDADDYEGDSTAVSKRDLRRVLNRLSHAHAAGAADERKRIVDLVGDVRRKRMKSPALGDMQTEAREDAEDELAAAIIASLGLPHA